MRFFEKLFNRNKQKETKEKLDKSTQLVMRKTFSTDFEPLPVFIEASPEEYQLVSVIASAIAAGDHPKSKFVIKSITKKNPEVNLIAVLLASIAANEETDKHFRIKSISARQSIEKSEMIRLAS